jgi:hypothetical protein
MTSPRDARPVRCPDCKAQVLRGVNDNVAAFTVWVDQAPLGVVGEALAHLTGRATYALRRHGANLRLYRRDQWQIGSRAAVGRFPVDVVADHCCGQSLPSIASAFTPTTRTGTEDGPVPY